MKAKILVTLVLEVIAVKGLVVSVVYLGSIQVAMAMALVKLVERRGIGQR